MIIVDNALRAREAEGRPIRVALIGAGFMSQGLSNHIVNTTPGMRLVAVYNRRVQRAFDLCQYAGVNDVASPTQQGEVDRAIREGKVVVTDNAFSLTRSANVDVLVDVTGSVEFGARVALDAFEHKKDIVLLNAEIDATIGPILQVYAEKQGAIMSACDGDEPGVQINLYRWVKGLGLTPRVMGNIKGLQDPYRNPTTQKGFAEKWGQNPAMVTSFADGSKISFEQSIVANATGFVVRTVIHRGVILTKEKIRDAQRLRQQIGFKKQSVKANARLAARVPKAQLGCGCSANRPSKRANLVQIQPPGQARIVGVHAPEFIQHELFVPQPIFDGHDSIRIVV